MQASTMQGRANEVRQNEVTGLLAELLRIDPARVAFGMNLRDDLGADSLVLIDVMVQSELRWGVRLSEDDIAALKTVADLVHLLDGKRNGRASG
jgi:acyl carrier protein